jgi:hypothetical protein
MGYVKDHANAFCIIEMHKAEKNGLQWTMQTTMHFFLWEERMMQNISTFSPMHL